MMLLLAVFNRSFATCPSVTTAELTASLSAAEAAYASLDLDGFRSAYATATEQLVCLSESLGRVEAATVHRVTALERYVSQDPEAALAALRSALATWSGAAPSSTIAPEGNPLHALTVQARDAGTGAQSPLSDAAPLSLWVDGAISTEHPTERPYILQAIGDDGAVVWSGYQDTGATPPDWVDLGLIAAPLPPTPPRFHSKMLLSGAVVAAAGGGLYAYSWRRSSLYRDPTSGIATNRTELADYKQVTNILATASTATVGVGVGLTGLSFAIGGRL